MQLSDLDPFRLYSGMIMSWCHSSGTISSFQTREYILWSALLPP